MDGNPVPDAKDAALTASAQPPLASRSDELVKYLVVELHVPRENHQKFQDEMKNLVEVMFDYKRWELVFATYPIFGELNRFIHVWKIPDESTVVDVMRAGALGAGGPAGDPGDAPDLEEQFRRCYQLVQSLIVDTRHTLMTSLPYDPHHVGYQSQTILIDAEGEPFVIDHDELRTATDISDQLEDVRRGKVKIRVRDGQRKAAPKARARQAKVNGQNGALAAATLDRIQDHLNRGSAVATIKNDGSRALLFNLACLKPRSVFQKIDTANALKQAPSFSQRQDGNQKVDLHVDELFIATPWGSVYRLNHRQLAGITKVVAQENKADVAKALKPIVDDDTPLAAIPEERDQIIGDGCACYVINLKSFVTSLGAATTPKEEHGTEGGSKRANR